MENILEFSEYNMRKIGDVKKALDIFTKQGYGYKQIVKKYFEAFEISNGRGATFSVAPFTNASPSELYEKLPKNFKQLLPIEVVEKQNAIFKQLVQISEKEGKPLKEVAKEYFKPKNDNDGEVRPKEPRNPLEPITKA